MPNAPGHSSPEGGNADQIAYWNARAGATWTAFQDGLDALFEPLTKLALDAAAPAPGELVIDVGCGCGATLLALAGRIGPTGKVVGLDVSEQMSARARDRIAAASLTNARVIVSDAATHNFPRDTEGADLLFSRFGIMFFTDPVAAFANLRQAMRQGGRMLCAVWRPLQDNAWFSVPLEAARTLLPPQPATDPEAPGPFALANPDRTHGLLTRAGWSDVKLTRQDVPMRFAGAGQVDQASDFAMSVGALARSLADAGPEVRAPIREAVAQALRTYDSPAGINLNGSIWLISARA